MFKPGTSTNKPQEPRTEKVRANAVSPPKEQRKDIQKQSRTKLDALRAEGKCFHCEEKGHEQRNCPKRHTMRPPKPQIKASSIRFDKIERLVAQKEEADLYIGNINVLLDPIEIETSDDVKARVHRICEVIWGADPAWHNEQTRHECLFSVDAGKHRVTVWNHLSKEDRTFDRAELRDPEFSLEAIFGQDPEMYEQTNSVREGRYQLLEGEEYLQWEWPAISWLQARLNTQIKIAEKDSKELKQS